MDTQEPSGRVKFDDRGNATWETWRGRRLDHPGLAILDQEPVSAGGASTVNASGGRIGYNPYHSGLIGGKPKNDKPKKKDLRALSRWIKMKKAIPEQA